MTTPKVPHTPDDSHIPDGTHAAGRIRRHLEASTDHLDLVATPISQLKGRADQRTARRQRVAALGVVAAVSIAVVGGVAVLSQSEPSSVVTSSETGGESGTDSLPGTDGPGTDPGTAPPVTGAAAPEAPPATIVFGQVSEPDPFGDLGLPQEVDPAFVWKVVDPGKEASISSTFSGTLQGAFPTFALSTAPGRSNDYDNIETFLYRSDDGISWTRTGAQSPFASGYWNAQVNDAQIFVTGTMPGIAQTQANPLQIAVGGGDAWEIAELPIDTNAASTLPMVNTGGPQVGSVPYGDGVLVVVTDQAYPDYAAITDALGVDPNDAGIIDQQSDGVTVVDGACINEVNGQFDPTDELFGPADGLDTVSATSVLGPFEDGDDYYGCPVVKKTWAQLGMPPESVEALSTSMSRFFTVSAALEITEIDAPSAGSFYPVGGQEPIVELAVNCCTETAAPRYELVDGAWVESAPGANSILARQGVQLQQLGDLRVGMFGPLNDGSTPFMSIASDGTQSGVDLQEMLATGAPSSSSWAQYTATTGAQWVGAVQTYDDPIALEGGIEVTFGDVVIRQETQQSRFVVLDAASREPIDRELVSGDANGNVEVRTEGGDVRAEFNVEAVYNALSPSGDQQLPPSHSIITTADGTSFSVESVATLLGLTDADVSRVARVASNGTSVIVTVTLADRYADDTRKQLVLVGTPIG